MPSLEELKQLQSLPLDIKIMKSKERIREWVEYFGKDNVHVSFSGGKDSTVLLHLVRSMYPDIEAVFVNTGLEYPEIQLFVKSFDNVTILRPQMQFGEVISIYGYPFIRKQVGATIRRYKEGKDWAVKAMNGLHCKTGEKSDYCEHQYAKWKPLTTVDFNISDVCCSIIKEKPLFDFNKKTGKYSFIATLAEESKRRERAWCFTGCNAFDSREQLSKPLSFWLEQDILQYIKQNNLPIASVYGNVVYETENGEQYDNLLCDMGCKLKCTNAKRTGCIFCGFGAHLDKRNGTEPRFLRLKRTHPRQYEYCMGGGGYDTDGLWKPNKQGLGMAHCIDEINKIYGKNFIEY